MAPFVDCISTTMDCDDNEEDYNNLYFHQSSSSSSYSHMTTTNEVSTIRSVVSSSMKQQHTHHDEEGKKRRLQHQKKQNVSFSEYSEMYFVPHIDDMTDEEYYATYMSEEDFARIQKETLHDVEEMTIQIQSEQKHSFEYMHENFRGLLSLSPKARISRKQRILFYQQQVFQRQQQQSVDGGKGLDPEWVIQYLSPISQPFVQAAYRMATYDTRYVLQNFKKRKN